MKISIPLLVLLSCSPALVRPAEGPMPEMRQRLLVLTDIEAGPDDTQSLIRLLLYSNQIDIEVFVATPSVHQRHAVYPDSIRRVLDAHGAVQRICCSTNPGFPLPQNCRRACGPASLTPDWKRLARAAILRAPTPSLPRSSRPIRARSFHFSPPAP